MMERSGVSSAVIALLLMAVQVHAAEIEPRAYVNTPVGNNFLLAGYSYSQGGLSTAGSLPIKNADLQTPRRRSTTCCPSTTLRSRAS